MRTRRWRRLGTSTVKNCIAIVVTVVFLFPIIWMILCSLKSEAEIFQSPPTILPAQFYIEAYLDQLRAEIKILGAFYNSFIISISTTVISIGLAVFSAYGLARFRMRWSRLVVLLFLVTQMFPPSVLLTPMFIIYARIRLLNTYLAPIISTSTITIPFAVLILRTYFLSIPRDLESSALIDGCSPFGAVIRIILPVSYPGLVMISSVSFLMSWGNLIYPLTFIMRKDLRPMTAGIYNFIGEYGVSWNRIMAFGVVTVLPVVLIFILLQRYLIEGLTSGAVKG